MLCVLFAPGATRVTDSTGQIGEKAEDQTGAKVITTLKGSMGERITKALNKVEEKKKKRAERRSQVTSLNKSEHSYTVIPVLNSQLRETSKLTI